MEVLNIKERHSLNNLLDTSWSVVNSPWAYLATDMMISPLGLPCYGGVLRGGGQPTANAEVWSVVKPCPQACPECGKNTTLRGGDFITPPKDILTTSQGGA